MEKSCKFVVAVVVVINLFFEIELGYKYFLWVREFAVDLLASSVSVNHFPQNDAVVVWDGHHVAVVMSHLHLPANNNNNNFIPATNAKLQQSTTQWPREGGKWAFAPRSILHGATFETQKLNKNRKPWPNDVSLSHDVSHKHHGVGQNTGIVALQGVSTRTIDPCGTEPRAATATVDLIYP